jgi:Domain of unknown function (DUF3846)
MTQRPVRALIIQPDGRSEDTTVQADLAGLNAAVGGLIECVTLRICHLYCDEEGKLKGLPVNKAATALAHTLGWMHGDVLCGPVIFLGNHPQGAEADVPQSVIDTWNGLQFTG